MLNIFYHCCPVKIQWIYTYDTRRPKESIGTNQPWHLVGKILVWYMAIFKVVPWPLTSKYLNENASVCTHKSPLYICTHFMIFTFSLKQKPSRFLHAVQMCYSHLKWCFCTRVHKQCWICICAETESVSSLPLHSSHNKAVAKGHVRWNGCQFNNVH